MEKELSEIKERLSKLEGVVFGKHPQTFKEETETTDPDFSLGERAFIKEYGSGFNGQEFVGLITAYLAQGKKSAIVELSQIKSVWKSCSGIIGVPYASIFSTRAKENSWTDAVKNSRASYTLGKHWQDIFKKSA